MEINYQDLERLERITKVTYSIENLYKKFILLEQKGMKDTTNYNKYLYYLEVVLELENKCYNNYNLGAKEIIKLDELLYLMTDISEYSDDAIINQEYDKRVVGRIKNNLLAFGNNDKTVLSKYAEYDEFSLLDNAILIERDSELNLKIAFLYLLDKYINDNNYKNIRNQLIEAKYTFIFTNKDIEKLFIENKFMLEDIIYIDNSYDIIEEEKIGIIKEFAQLCYLENFEKLLKIEDLDYNDSNNVFTSILRQCFVRASFLLMDNSTIDELNYYFHEQLDNNGFISKYKNSNVSQKLIIECYRKIKKDRQKIRILKV